MIVAGVSLWIVSRSLLQCSEDHGAEHEQGGDDEDDQQFADHGTGTRRVSSSNQFWTSTTWMGVSLSAGLGITDSQHQEAPVRPDVILAGEIARTVVAIEELSRRAEADRRCASGIGRKRGSYVVATENPQFSR